MLAATAPQTARCHRASIPNRPAAWRAAWQAIPAFRASSSAAAGPPMSMPSTLSECCGDGHVRAGKSTLPRCLASPDRPTSGRVRRMSGFSIYTVLTGRGGRKAAATRRILVCTATCAALTVVGCGGPSRPAEPSHPPRCASQLFLGVRGSGEDPTQLLGMGTAVYAIFTGLRTADRRLAGFGWPYYGARPDTAELKRATAALGRFMRERARQCPAERIVLAGYSDGAQIVGDAVQGYPAECS
jgi:Cutinase